MYIVNAKKKNYAMQFKSTDNIKFIKITYKVKKEVVDFNSLLKFIGTN